MSEIIKEILKNLPEGKISEAGFEGANIVLYTMDREYFKDNKGTIKEVVDMIKKRIELRPDPKICIDQEKTKEIINKLVSKEAKVTNIIFDPQRSQVIIEAERPGLAIGKQGEILREIRNETFWVPLIKRTPAIPCPLIDNIRGVLYENSDERRKFLDKTGHRIYDGWIRGKKNEWVRLTFLGGSRQVGRSCILLQTPESRVLLDCGIDPARTDNGSNYPYLEAPEFKINELDAVIVSHAHLDHSGLIPLLFKYGYKGPIYCTAPTRDIMSLIQLDVVKISRNEGKEPLYSSDEVKEMVKHTICLDYDEVSDITPDVRITLYNAGHILGSAMVHLHIGNGLHNLLYTGDIKYGKTLLLEPAVTKFPRLETMIIESTYGAKDKIMPPHEEADTIVSDIIKNTVKRKGKVLIPVLGSGRAQEILILVENLIRNKEIEEIPIYIDGMVWDITAIHTAYPEYLNSVVRKKIFHKDANPFLNPVFKRVGSNKERKQVIEEEGSCVILATSGMLVGGPSVEYLKNLADSDKNSLVFSSFQAEGSLGRRIQNGEREIVFQEGQKQNMVKINMEVHKIEITGHSDRKQLMNFVNRLDPRPKKIIVQHGESSSCLDFASSIHKQNHIETVAPRNLDSIRIK